MKKRIALVVVFPALLLALVGLSAYSPAVSAQETLPSVMVGRQQQNSTAEWTVTDMVFESNYPDGFTVQVQVSSSGGAVERARLIWHRPNLRSNQNLTVYAEEGSIDPAAGRVTASWQPDKLQMVPPWVVIRYYWEFRDAAGNVFETEPVSAEYEDATRPWTRSESDDAIVFTSDLEGGIEELVLDAMARQHETYIAVWGAALSYKPRIVLFGDYDAWLEWRTADTNVSDTQVVVGQTFDEWGAIVQVLFGTDQEAAYQDLAYGTVVHEVEHLYQNEFLSGRKRVDVPGWFFEGDATFFELLQSYDYEGLVRQRAKNNDLPPLFAGIANGPRVEGENPREGYDIGYTLFVWLEQLNGDLSVHRDVMTLLAADVPFEEALATATEMSTAEIERNWRTWLGATSDAPTLIPTWTPPAFLPSPTPSN